MTERLTRFLARHALPFLILFTVLAAAGVWGASQLRLSADFTDLLPDHLPSVEEMDRINEQVGGLGNFVIVIESEDVEASQRFADAIVEKLRTEVPDDLIRYIDYKTTTERAFFTENKYLYIDVADLKLIHDRLKTKVEWDLKCKNVLFFDLTGECSNDPGFDMSDVQEKYVGRDDKYEHYIGDYYTNKNGSLLAVLVKPTGDQTKMDHVRYFLGTVIPVIEGIDKARFHESIQLHYTGAYMQVLTEYNALKRDISVTGTLALALVALVVFLYYRNVRTLFFITGTVLYSLVITYGIAWVLVGIITSMTALMGSIILGNGINNGLIFMARYLEERRRDEDWLQCLATAARTTVGATFTAAFTTAAAFATLHLSDLRAYKQFGTIGTIGMILAWVATYTVLPCLVAFFEKIRPIAGTAVEKAAARGVSNRPSTFIVDRPRGIAIAGMLVTLAAIPMSYLFWSHPWETNYRNIRSEWSLRHGPGYWDRRIMDEIFTVSLTPLVIVADTREQANEVRAAIIEKRDAKPESMVADVWTFDSFIPENQNEKLEWIGKIRELLSGSAIGFVKGEQRQELKQVQQSFDLDAISPEEIPETIRRHFVEKDGTFGRLVYVFPDNSRNLWIVEHLHEFSEEVRKTVLADGDVVHASGEAVIISDILTIVERDGPRIIALALFGVLVLLLLKFRNPIVALQVFLPLGVGYLWLGMFLEIFAVRISFINYIILPMAIGIGMDYSANVFHRYRLEGEGNISNVLRTTGGAVMLCSLTTMIGYAVLIAAESLAFVSFGKLGLISELCTVTAAVVLAPALLVLHERRKLRQAGSGPDAGHQSGDR